MLLRKFSVWTSLFSLIMSVALGNLGSFLPQNVAYAANTYIVDDLGDSGDSNPGDGICDTGAGVCTLRAAIEESEADSTESIINFAELSGTITLGSHFEWIDNPVIIEGPGDGSIIIDGDTRTIFYFNGDSEGSIVSGLNLEDCTAEGGDYCIKVEANNVTIDSMNIEGGITGDGDYRTVTNSTFTGGNAAVSSYSAVGGIVQGNTFDCDGVRIDGDIYPGQSIIGLTGWDGESGTLIDGNEIIDCGGNFAIDGTGEDLTITNNTITNFTGGPGAAIIVKTESDGITISGNVIDGVTGDWTPEGGGNLGAGISVQSSWFEGAGETTLSDLEISNNTVSNTTGRAIEISSLEALYDSVVSGNTVSSVGDTFDSSGISIHGIALVSDLTIDGNTSHSNSGPGMVLSDLVAAEGGDSGITISNNILYNNSESNLWIDSCPSPSEARLIYITGNSLYNSPDGYGLLISDSSDFVTVNMSNLIYSNALSGISVQDSSNQGIASNEIYSNTQHGISFSNSTLNSVNDNEIHDNNGYGIKLESASNENIFLRNIVTDNKYAVNITDSEDNEFTDNIYESNAAEVTSTSTYTPNLVAFSYNGEIYGTMLNEAEDGFEGGNGYAGDGWSDAIYDSETPIDSNMNGLSNFDLVLGTCTWGGTDVNHLVFVEDDYITEGDADGAEDMLDDEYCGSANSISDVVIFEDVLLAGGVGEDFSIVLPDGVEYGSFYNFTNALMGYDGTDTTNSVMLVDGGMSGIGSQNPAMVSVVDGSESLNFAICSLGGGAVDYTIYFDDEFAENDADLETGLLGLGAPAPVDCIDATFKLDALVSGGAGEDFTTDFPDGVTPVEPVYGDGEPDLSVYVSPELSFVFSEGTTSYDDYAVYVGGASQGNVFSGETFTGSGNVFDVAGTATDNTVEESELLESMGNDVRTSSGGTTYFDNTTFNVYEIISGVLDISFDVDVHIEDAWGELEGVSVTVLSPSLDETALSTDVDGDASAVLSRSLSAGSGNLETSNVFTFGSSLAGYTGDSYEVGINTKDQEISIVLNTVTECNDGLDNDGDGDIDSEDTDCTDKDDDVEGVVVPPGDDDDDDDDDGGGNGGGYMIVDEGDDDDDDDDDDTGDDDVEDEIDDATNTVTDIVDDIVGDDDDDADDVVEAIDEYTDTHDAPSSGSLVPKHAYMPETGVVVEKLIKTGYLLPEEEEEVERYVNDHVVRSLEKVVEIEGLIVVHDGLSCASISDPNLVTVIFAPLYSEAEVAKMKRAAEAEGKIALVIEPDSDADRDYISDTVAIMYGLPMFNADPDNDGINSVDELSLGLDPFIADSVVDAAVTNVDGQTLGSRPSFRLRGMPGQELELVLVPFESYDGKNDDYVDQLTLGNVVIDEDYKGELYVDDPIANGDYYVLVNGKKGYSNVSRFRVDNSVDNEFAAPEIEPEFATESVDASCVPNLGRFVAYVLKINKQTLENGEALDTMLASKIPDPENIYTIRGKSKPNSPVFISMKSVIFSSVVLADAKGEFSLRVAQNDFDVAEGEHHIVGYSADPATKTVGNSAVVAVRRGM